MSSYYVNNNLKYYQTSISNDSEVRNALILLGLRHFLGYSHSIVPMGLGVRSRHTRLMPSTSWVMRSVILCSRA